MEAAVELLQSSAHARDLATTQAAEASFRKEEEALAACEYEASALTLARQEAALLGSYILKVAANQATQKTMRRILGRLLNRPHVPVRFTDVATAESDLILASGVEYITDESDVPGYAEVVIGWKFNVAGGRAVGKNVPPEFALYGGLFAQNVVQDNDTKVGKVIETIYYDFLHTGYKDEQYPDANSELVKDYEGILRHRAIFRVARLELGDISVDK
jgi:hypothetical protein